MAASSAGWWPAPPSCCAGWPTGGPLSGLRLAPSPLTVLGAGLTVAVATSMGGWLFDEPFLSHDKVELDLPLFGDVKVTSALPFDIGVYLVVVGLVLTLLTTLGAEDPGADDLVDLDEDGRPVPDPTAEVTP